MAFSGHHATELCLKFFGSDRIQSLWPFFEAAMDVRRRPGRA